VPAPRSPRGILRSPPPTIEAWSAPSMSAFSASTPTTATGSTPASTTSSSVASGATSGPKWMRCVWSAT